MSNLKIKARGQLMALFGHNRWGDKKAHGFEISKTASIMLEMKSPLSQNKAQFWLPDNPSILDFPGEVVRYAVGKTRHHHEKYMPGLKFDEPVVKVCVEGEDQLNKLIEIIKANYA